eukprot:1163425-Amphidinium_carterae.1
MCFHSKQQLYPTTFGSVCSTTFGPRGFQFEAVGKMAETSVLSPNGPWAPPDVLSSTQTVFPPVHVATRIGPLTRAIPVRRPPPPPHEPLDTTVYAPGEFVTVHKDRSDQEAI